jgi:ABC-type uncharacterized transport system permease subunit
VVQISPVQPQKYLTVFNLGIQNTFVYRWNYLLRAIFGIIPLIGTVFLWRDLPRGAAACTWTTTAR